MHSLPSQSCRQLPPLQNAPVVQTLQVLRPDPPRVHVTALANRSSSPSPLQHHACRRAALRRKAAARANTGVRLRFAKTVRSMLVLVPERALQFQWLASQVAVRDGAAQSAKTGTTVIASWSSYTVFVIIGALILLCFCVAGTGYFRRRKQRAEAAAYDAAIAERQAAAAVALPGNTALHIHHLHHYYSQQQIHQTVPEPEPIPPQQIHTFNPQSLTSFISTGDETQIACPICLEPFGVDPVSAGSCNHKMHTACIRNWLMKGVSCPVCREPFVDQSSEHQNQLSASVSGQDSSSLD